MTVSNNDTGSVILEGAVCVDDIFTAAGAVTILEGTILARDSVSGKLVLFVKGGATNENGIPKAILTYETAAAGAGDITVRPAVSGKFRQERLVIAADGDATNVDAAVLDQLRNYGLVAVPVTERNIQDNQ
jgi:hypothetical protein